MQEENAGLATKGPGEKLRQARESFGLTTWDVASQLYLPERIIAALDEDHYGTHLPAQAFVRGYLRSYAKLLKISPEEILAEFDALELYKKPQEEHFKSLSQPRLAVTVHKDKFWFNVVGGGIFGVLLLIVSLTWLNTRQEKNETIVEQVLQEESSLSNESAAEPAKSEVLSQTNDLLNLNGEELKKPAPAQKKLSESNVELINPVSNDTPNQASVEFIPTLEQAQVIQEQQQMTPVDAPLPVAQLSSNEIRN